MTKLSCIIVNYRMVHFTRNLLQGIHDAAWPFSFECVVVDNASQDGIGDLVRERFPWVQMLELPENIGLGSAANRALVHCSGDYVLFMNPDITMFRDSIERWITWMDMHPDVGVSGPRLLNPDGTDQESCFRFPTIGIPLYRRTVIGLTPWGKRAVDRYVMRGMDRTQEQDVDWVLGAAMLIRRSVLDQIGRFDEQFFLYFEDADVCHRVWQSGLRVAYVPHVKLVHYYQRQSRTRFAWQGAVNSVTRQHIASGVRYFLKYR